MPFRFSLIPVLALLAVGAPAARASGGFGIEPGTYAAGTFTSEGAGGPLGEGATPDTQAGSHPYEATTTFKLKTKVDEETGATIPEGDDIKDTVVNLPAGFAGDPNAVPYCSEATLIATTLCPTDTVVGVVHLRVTVEERVEDVYFLPIYNMAPGRGQVALFAFHVGEPLELLTFIHVHVRSTSDYGVTATVSAITQIAQTLEGTVTLWGVPANSRHDPYRGQTQGEVAGGPEGYGCMVMSTGVSGGECPSDAPPRAFLTNPSACSGQPLTTTFDVDSWANPGQSTAGGEPILSDPNWLTYAAESPALEGCEKLVFDPSLMVMPETSTIDTPTGLQVDLHVPQNEDPDGLATPDLRDATVTLPAGVALSAAAASGLEGCTPEAIGLHTEDPVSCPNGSKLGTVQVQSPDLPRNANGSEGELTGSVYLGAPSSGSITEPPYTIYLVAEGYGVSVRLAGSVSPNPLTGQLTTTFTENPPLPFEDLKLDFFGGSRAPLSTPPACGSYTTTSQIVPYSSPIAATPSSSFETSFDGNGAPCPSPLPFAPLFSAGSTATAAGAFGSFVLNVSRADGQQALSTISLSTPPGLLGMLSTVSLCEEPQAAQGSCSAASQIGTATASVGAGSEPFTTSGPVYLTGPYKGAPFGLSVAIPAKAGPFNFGTVIVRSAIYVNAQTGALTVNSDLLPQMVDTSQTDSGVPVALQSVSVDINRPGFIFNPTSCNPMSVAGALSLNQGTTAAVSSPFQVVGCAGLPFKPTFAVSTQAKASKQYGASLNVKVSSGTSQANIAKVDVSLPKQLPSRLSTLQKACTEAQFAANPAGCPADSIVGLATAHTPVLNVPLTGPAILVSHGGAAFPDLVVILQGQGVTIELTGNTDIKSGITYSRFETVPDAPISTFELQLPEGPHSILGTYLPASANYDLCGQALTMPTTITGQSGAQVKQTTKISVTGCPAAKAAVKITKATATATRLLVTLAATTKGTVTLSGKGLKTTKRNLKKGTSKIRVPLTQSGQAMHEHHDKLELHARITAGAQAAAKTASVKL